MKISKPLPPRKDLPSRILRFSELQGGPWPTLRCREKLNEVWSVAHFLSPHGCHPSAQHRTFEAYQATTGQGAWSRSAHRAFELGLVAQTPLGCRPESGLLLFVARTPAPPPVCLPAHAQLLLPLPSALRSLAARGAATGADRRPLVSCSRFLELG
jgi:hypothetical protein